MPVARSLQRSCTRVGTLAGLCLALLAGTTAPAHARQQGVDQVFPAAPAGYLTDVAGVVDAASAARIESLAKRLREQTGAEVAVVTLPSLGQYEASDVALAIGRKWGVGAKAEIGSEVRNAGMVVLLVPKTGGQPGKIRLEVGQGLEGIIPDARAARIRDAMRPQLAAGEYGPGLVTGVEAIAALVARDLGVSDTSLVPAHAGSGGGISPFVFFLLLFVLVAMVMAMASARSSKVKGGRRRPRVYWGPGPWIGGGGGGFGGGGFGGGGFGGFGGGGGFSGGGAGGSF